MSMAFRRQAEKKGSEEKQMEGVGGKFELTVFVGLRRAKIEIVGMAESATKRAEMTGGDR